MPRVRRFFVVPFSTATAWWDGSLDFESVNVFSPETKDCLELITDDSGDLRVYELTKGSYISVSDFKRSKLSEDQLVIDEIFDNKRAVAEPPKNIYHYHILYKRVKKEPLEHRTFKVIKIIGMIPTLEVEEIDNKLDLAFKNAYRADSESDFEKLLTEGLTVERFLHLAYFLKSCLYDRDIARYFLVGIKQTEDGSIRIFIPGLSFNLHPKTPNLFSKKER